MKKYIFVLIPLLIVLGLNIYFRSFTINFPQFKKQAQGIVAENIRQRAAQEVYAKFPYYDPLAKEKLIKTRIVDYYAQAKGQIRQQVEDIYQQIKSRFQDDNGQTYLMELDCWHWARYTENVIYLGHPGDKIVNGKQFDDLMITPQGFFLPWDNFLFYFSALLFKIFSFFKYVPLFTFVFYLPLFFTTLFVIVLYLFSYRLGGALCAITSALFIGLFPSFIPRSCAGWFDKDILNLVFPVIIIWTYLVCHETHLDNIRKKTLLLLFSSFWVGLFCFTWGSWWFIFVILLGYEILTLAVLKLSRWSHNKDISHSFREHLFSLVSFFVFTALWILIICGLEPFVALYIHVREAVTLSNPVLTSIWPNVYSTVGELKKTSINEIIQLTWGLILFVPALISMFALLARYLFFSKGNNFKRNAIIILFLWFLSMFLACLQGVRFVVFLALPLGIALGWGINDFYQYFKIKGQRIVASIIASTIIIVMGCYIISTADRIAKGIYPLMNDGWYKFLTMLESTPKNSVINSWWDFGDWFKVVAKRKVIFDGQSQNRPQAYWMAKAILSTDENESLGILRMLNNSGNEVFEIIDEYLKNPLRSMLLLESVVALDSGKAKEVLSDFLPPSAVDKAILLLFDTPPPAYFIVDYSMISKITAISYLGNWNFSKVYMVQNLNKTEKDQILDYLIQLGKNNEEMQQLYQEAFLISRSDLDRWISRPVQFYSDVLHSVEKDGVVFFNNGFIYNSKEQTVHTNDGKIPRSLFIQDGDSLKEFSYQNANLIFSILIYKENDVYKGVLLDRDLANSLFVKLYFLKGRGLKHFKGHIDVQEGDNYIGSYKIEW
ncbi:MAG: STT3 domain-containing protein [Candidatus Omnitrophica bacterium]|nr:STT3 domain-containing protein [Candidatus Omnitrophota bacterium]